MGLFELANVTIETAIVLFFCNSVFVPRGSLNKGIRFSLIAAVITVTAFTGSLRLGTGINLAISYCICFIISYVLYEGSLYNKLFMSAIYVVMIIASDYFATLIITNFGIEYSMSGGDDITYICGAMLSDFIRLWLLAYIGKLLSRRMRELPLQYWIFLFICPVLSVMCLIIFDIYLMQAETVNSILVFIPPFCVLYISFMLFSFFESYSEQIRLKVVEKLAKQEEENYKILQNNESELRKLRHDMKNHIMMLNEYLKRGDSAIALEHLSDINNTLDEITAIVYTSNPAIDAAINIGAKKARTENIDYKAQIIGDTVVAIEAADICKFLSNAIDNAIEACSLCEERYVYIELNISKESLKIHIENPTIQKQRIIKLLTSKSDKINHGYGISSMRSVVRKYKGIMNITISDGIFYLDAVLGNN